MVASAQDTERKRPEAWKDLVYGGRFMDRFLSSPVRNELTSDTWGVDAVKPRDILNSIEHPDWSYWGGHVQQIGDVYHFYVCRWPEKHPKGHMGWWDAEVVHTVGPKPWGPFQPVKVIGRGYNPEVYQNQDGSYALYVHHPTYFKDKKLEPGAHAHGTWYIAQSLLGPWTTKEFVFDVRGRRIIDGLSNISFSQREDGSILAVCRGGGIWVNKTGLSTWEQVSNRRVYPGVEGRFEDPVIWKTHVQYHMIVNDWLGRIAWYLRSQDGFDWKVEPGEAYAPGIDRYEDGSSLDWYKYERLKFQQDKYGRPLLAYFAVIDYSKWEDKPNDIHNSKNIAIPITVERLITVLNREPIGPDTKTIRLKVSAEPGFDPHKDMDIASLRFGASEEVNFGHGCKVISSQADGKDLILSFNGKGNGFTADNFAGKLLGKTANGKLLFGYARLPGVSYGDAFLSADLPVAEEVNGQLKLSVKVKNYGLSASKTDNLDVRIFSGSVEKNLKLYVPALPPHQETTLAASIKSKLDPGLKYQVKITTAQQKTPLYESEQHKHAPLLHIGVASVDRKVN